MIKRNVESKVMGPLPSSKSSLVNYDYNSMVIMMIHGVFK